MSKPSWKRSLWWTLVAGVLVGVGVGAYRVTPPAPMCVIDASGIEPHRFVANGRLVTFPQLWYQGLPRVFLKENERYTVNTMVGIKTGPVRVWDARNGKEIARHLADNRKMHACTLSKDGRWFAAEILKTHIAEEPGAITITSLTLLDLENGNVRELPLEDSTIDGELHFSRSGALLVRLSAEGKSLRIYDTASGRLLDERASIDLIWRTDFSQPDFTDELLIHQVPTKSEQGNVEIWNPHGRKLLATFENASASRSPDDHYLMVERLSADEKAPDKYSIWNLRANRLESEFQMENEIMLGMPCISDEFLAVAWNGPQGSFIDLRELPSAKRIARAPADKLRAIQLSREGRFLAVSESWQNPDKRVLKVLEVPTLKQLWQRDVAADCDLHSFDSSTAFTLSFDRAEGLVYNSATGQRRVRIPWLTNPQIKKTPDGCFVLIHADSLVGIELPPGRWTRWLQWMPWLDQSKRPQDTVIVFDMEACRERFRLQDWGVSSVILSDDGLMVATMHREADERRVLRVWDVDAWKPLHFAIGVPAGLGTLIVLAAWWRCRRLLARARSVEPAPMC